MKIDRTKTRFERRTFTLAILAFFFLPSGEIRSATAVLSNEQAKSHPQYSLQPTRAVVKPLTGGAVDSLGYPIRKGVFLDHRSIEFLQEDALFGSSLALGDLTGDGQPELIIGARSCDVQAPNAGAVFIYESWPNGGADLHGTLLYLGRPRASFGCSIAFVGDVNGDGYGDLIAGALRYPEGGSAMVYYGAATLGSISTNALWTRAGDQRGELFGYATAYAGDVNGDGFADIIVGAPRRSARFRYQGQAKVFLGSKSGLGRDSHVILVGLKAEVLLGSAVACAGDVNGDGYADVLVGAPDYDTDKEKAGRVTLYLGSPTGLTDSASWVMEGSDRLGRFGASLAGIGDVNGDGFDDIAIGAPGPAGTRADWPGKVYVYFGSAQGPGERPDWVAQGEQSAARFGAIVAPAGDLNGDGHVDLLIGAPYHHSTHPDEGRVYVYLGNGHGLEDSPSWTLDGGQDSARHGWAICGGVDLNHDGLSDFAVGSPYYTCNKKSEGRVDIFYGSRSNYQRILTPFTNAFISALPPGRQGAGKDSRIPLYIAGFIVLVFGGILALRHRQVLRTNEAEAIQRERTRMARDLHDQFGAEFAHLSLLEDRAESSSSASSNVAGKARQMMQAMEEVVWATNPAHDTLESLATFLGQYAEQLFSGTPIRYFQDIPISLEDRPLPPRARKNVLLAVKEALANALKHSKATELWLRVALENSVLTITLEDNGCGMPSGHTRRFGNGLANMKTRLEEIGGTVEIDGSHGTKVRFVLPLPKITA